jgi:FAD/FMN-containing dehydrogenase
MGVVTWANFKIEYLPKIDKILFAPVRDLDYAIEFLYRILRIRIGQECLLLNNINLATIIADVWPRDFEELRPSLPPWTLILVISGFQRRPEEKIQYEEQTLGEILRNEFPEIHLADNLAGFPGLGKKLLPMLRQPWPEEVTYWKKRYKGGCQSLFFITKPTWASKFISKVEEIAARHAYPISDIGGYLQPIEHNRACHLEFDFFYDPASYYEVERVRSLYSEATKVLLSEGALFTRPYGEELTRLVYERAADYTMTLKRVKKIFDPNHIMNPGNLCF